MIHYVHLETLAVHTIDEIRAMHPNVSLPANANCDVLGYERLVETPYPPYDQFTQGVRNATPVNIEGEWLQRWEVFPLPQEESDALQYAARKAQSNKAKAARAAAVDAIKVTTQAGHTFDGDEASQTRMARAIVAMQAAGTPTITWVLADNRVIQATAQELTEALALAGAAQAAIWVIEEGAQP